MTILKTHKMQLLDKNINAVVEMKIMLKNLVIPSLSEIELTHEWKILLSLETNYLKTDTYELLKDNVDVIEPCESSSNIQLNCNKCHRKAIYTTKNMVLCWNHSI